MAWESRRRVVRIYRGTGEIAHAAAEADEVAGSGYAATSGRSTFGPGETTRTILVQTIDDAVAEPTETITANLPNPFGTFPAARAITSLKNPTARTAGRNAGRNSYHRIEAPR